MSASISGHAPAFPGAGSDGPLAGRLVADFTENLPGPMATMLLCQLGATVIKVERPGGEPGRRHPLFQMITAGKRSVELDLKTSEARASAFALAARADVVIEGFRPGVAERLGFGYESVAIANPNVVYCSLSGYGQHGSRRNRPGHDLTYLAESGLVFENRAQGGEQIMAPLPGLVADNLSGLLAAVAILGRLAAPGPASGPVYLDVAINDAALIPSLPSIAVLLSGRESQYVDVQEFPHYRIFATADGRHLALGITPWEQSFWDNLCVALDRPDFVSLSAEERRIRSPEIASVLADIFAADTLRGWETRLADVDVPWSPVRNPAEVLSQLNLAERPIVRTGTRVVDLLQTGHSGEVPAVGEANLAVAQWLKQVLGGRWRTRADEGGSGLLAERYLSYCSKL